MHPYARFAAIAVSSLLALLPAAVAGQTSRHPPREAVAVSAHAQVRARPDLARLRLGARTEAEQAEAALTANSARMEQLLTALRELGLSGDALQTASVRLKPEFSQPPPERPQSWQPKIVGFIATNHVEVRTGKLERVGRIMAEAVAAGANDIGDVRFALENDATAREEAIQRATDKALTEARTLAAAAGIELGSIVRLQLEPDNDRPVNTRRISFMAEAARANANVPVEPGEITIDASVHVAFAIRSNANAAP